MTTFSDSGAKRSRRTAVALAGTALLMGGLFALPAGAGQHKPSGSSSSSGHSASPRSGSSSSGSSASSSRSGSSSSHRAVPRSSSGGSSVGRTPQHSSRHRGSYHHGYGHYGRGYYGYYYPSFGYYWWNSFYSPWWAWGGPRVYVSAYPDRSGDSLGAIDTDVAPENAEVYVDGELVGTADDYDGWPSYLWLDAGTYDVVFYHQGYKTMARQIIVRPGALIDVEDEMERGDAVRPEDLGPKTHERRDARLAEEAEKQAAVEAQERQADGAWRDRVRSERRARTIVPPPAAEAEEVDRDLRSKPAEVTLAIEPSDATVYLDGKFLGSAELLARAGGPLLVDAGEHEIEVLRPGYGSKKQSFSVKAGEKVELAVELGKLE
ncbi:MAG: PEGA domain-containing protein [Thermoanaerobaculia bacterium]|nr:PEGA domain-containing protein [Thermoanaerobaculia bacterium]